MKREAVVTMDGEGKWAEVRGCCGILEYDMQRVKLRMEDGALVIEGDGLTLEKMDGEVVIVAGRIQGVWRQGGRGNGT